jgi:hypothetical protein
MHLFSHNNIKENIMDENKVYLVGVYMCSIRLGEPGEIIGVEMATPEHEDDLSNEIQPCFKVRYRNDPNLEFHIAILPIPGSKEFNSHYEIATREDYERDRRGLEPRECSPLLKVQL